VARNAVAKKMKARKERLPTAVTFAWMRYFAGRTLMMVGMLVVTAAAALFFGADAERRMLGFTGVGAALFVTGWLLSKKRPPEAR